MTMFKVLGKDGLCVYGTGSWSLPTQTPDGTWTPGEWMPPVPGPLVVCRNGYHLCTTGQLTEWLNEEIYEAEYRGERLDSDNKIVVRESRLLRRFTMWDKRTARLFAADCAEHVLHHFEKLYPNDNRPRKAIEAARGSDRGLPAAWAAAGAAAWAAARNAAGAAAADADAAWNAAWAAAGAAAGTTAWAAAADAAWNARATAWAAAGNAEREWQTVTLLAALGEARPS